MKIFKVFKMIGKIAVYIDKNKTSAPRPRLLLAQLKLLASKASDIHSGPLKELRKEIEEYLYSVDVR